MIAVRKLVKRQAHDQLLSLEHSLNPVSIDEVRNSFVVYYPGHFDALSCKLQLMGKKYHQEVIVNLYLNLIAVDTRYAHANFTPLRLLLKLYARFNMTAIQRIEYVNGSQQFGIYNWLSHHLFSVTE